MDPQLAKYTPKSDPPIDMIDRAANYIVQIIKMHYSGEIFVWIIDNESFSCLSCNNDVHTNDQEKETYDRACKLLRGFSSEIVDAANKKLKEVDMQYSVFALKIGDNVDIRAMRHVYQS